MNINQHKYQVINTIKISLKETFHLVKCPTLADPERTGILQSYSTNLAPKILEAVQWEIDKLLLLSHPNLQSVIDVFATVDGLHIVREMEEWQCANNSAPYSPVRAKTLLQEILPALTYLHDRGIVHGNISHETIVVNDRNQHVLTDFLVVSKLIAEVGGDTYPTLRSQLEQIPVLNLPTGREWDLYSLGVTTIALLTDRDYQYLYDPNSRKWIWESYVDCSEELTTAIDRLLGQEKQPLQTTIVPSGPQVSNLVVASSNRQTNPYLYPAIVGSLLFGVLGLFGYLISAQSLKESSESARKPFPQSQILTVGYINRPPSRDLPQSQQLNYPEFKSYLETELRKKYGNAVKVELESAATTREAQNNISQKKWDVVFTFLANNSLVAEDNKYEFIARMSAKGDPYRDVCFFVRRNSRIWSTDDFIPERTIALPTEDTPIFVMPLFDLYGKTVRVNIGNTLLKIQQKVQSGEADIGVNFCNTISEKRQFRTLSPNRIIPVGGVFLSPTIAKLEDRNYIKDAIVKAPEDIQAQANYTTSSGINYAQFRRINNRATQLLKCIDLSRNPVEFYCNKQPQNDK